MNEKTRAQIEAMKNQTIGVEVEMNNITRQKAATKVAEFFGTTAYYAAAQYGYMTWACKDQQGRVWKFQRDVSISGPDEQKCELVTPILTYDDIETLQSIIRLLPGLDDFFVTLLVGNQSTLVIAGNTVNDILRGLDHFRLLRRYGHI